MRSRELFDWKSYAGDLKEFIDLLVRLSRYRRNGLALASKGKVGPYRASLDPNFVHPFEAYIEDDR